MKAGFEHDGRVPASRVTVANEAPVRPEGAFVLYWMIAQRRVVENFALEHAVTWARELGRPLLVFEPLRCDYPWASTRLHRFVLDGMHVNARRCAERGISYYPWVEQSPGDGRGLLAALAEEACVVVTDEFPAFFLPDLVRRAGRALDVRLEQVDANGVMPLRAADKAFPTAFAFRRHLQRVLPHHLAAFPAPSPLDALSGTPRALVPEKVVSRWPMASPRLLAESGVGSLADLPIDQVVRPASLRGGSDEAEARLEAFAEHRLDRYADDRNHPDDDVASGLSPFLHFGHLSAHRVVRRVLLREDWTPARLSSSTNGSRAGWWGLSPAAEAFLDQVVTWRELGFGFAFHRPDDYDHFEALPDWARATLEERADDPREHVYTLEELAAAKTHDPVWNAAQRQLVSEGQLHNYLRMLWGKNILAWTSHPRDALATMLELNNRYALDGRDPNSVSGIFWVLGRFDRAWGPRRPIFGTVRYMTSRSTLRKLRLRKYLARYDAIPSVAASSNDQSDS